MMEFIKLCKKKQNKLKRYVYLKLLEAGYTNVIKEDGFVYAKGDIPIMITSHLDTVHKHLCRKVVIEKHDNETIISSPQGIGGDDRCGVWIILELLGRGHKPSVLFCEDEEIGGIGSNKFAMSKYIDDLKEMKFLIEVDRANSNDLVFYDCGNVEFANFLEKETGFKESWGSFSDICHLSPECEVASVNFSCGYYKAHTTDEYVVYEEMVHTMETIEFLLMNADSYKAYDYQEVSWNYPSYSWNSYNHYYSYAKEEVNLYIAFMNDNGEEEDCLITEKDEETCWMNFFFKHPNTCFNDVQGFEIIDNDTLWK